MDNFGYDNGDYDVNMGDPGGSDFYEVVRISPDPPDSDSISSCSLDPAFDQGEGVPGEYVRMPNGQKLQDLLEKRKRKRLYLGDTCRCGNGKMIEKSRFSTSAGGQPIEYNFLACSDFRAGAGCTVTESLTAPRIPKYFFRSPVPNPSGANIFNFFIVYVYYV